jgi:hypothetical protein
VRIRCSTLAVDVSSSEETRRATRLIGAAGGNVIDDLADDPASGRHQVTPSDWQVLEAPEGAADDMRR